DFRLHHLDPFLEREHRALGGAGGDADYQPVDQLGSSPDDVGMTERDRIERARVEADASRVPAGVHRSRSTTNRASARSRSASSPWLARCPIACSLSASACWRACLAPIKETKVALRARASLRSALPALVSSPS